MTEETRTRPISDGLFEVDNGDLHFRCGRCRMCGHVAFPIPVRCSGCSSIEIDHYKIDGVGVLWTFTVQKFRPKPPYAGPAEFVPYGVGYVCIGDEIMIEGRLTRSSLDVLHIGMEMRAVTEHFTVDLDGNCVTTFAFAPVDENAR